MKKSSKYSSKSKDTIGSERIGESHRQFLKRLNSSTKYKVSSNDNDVVQSPTSLETHGFEFVENNSTEDDNSLKTTTHLEDQNSANLNTTHYTVENSASNKWFALSGRIGRLQLLAYNMIFTLLLSAFFIVIIVATSLVSAKPLLFNTNSLLINLFMIVSVCAMLLFLAYTSIILPKRRLHDINKSGWWLLISFLPPLSLILIYWLFIKVGNEGSNHFGPPPAPNSNFIKVLAFLYPVFIAIGLLSSSLLPAIPSEYSKRLEDPLIASTSDAEQQLETDASSNLAESDTLPNDLNTSSETSSDNGLTPNSSNSESLNTNTDTNTEVELNLDPEADPDVKKAIEQAVVQEPPSNNSVEDMSDIETQDYYEFLRASETPLLKEPLDLDNLEEIHVEN